MPPLPAHAGPSIPSILRIHKGLSPASTILFRSLAPSARSQQMSARFGRTTQDAGPSVHPRCQDETRYPFSSPGNHGLRLKRLKSSG
ncbi:nuclease PIN [Anopheles sinensis]|uniref:Nuclease PIN n=1 Tax=Anopheles sinensis TaxID=74873 RepID=A0A084WGR3_ANOSI|nr:nuclease PIN [Anopheles sinensis]